MKRSSNGLSRRHFLFAATGAAAATAALVTKQGADVQPGAKEKVAESKGYQLTEHIQNYYRSAKV